MISENACVQVHVFNTEKRIYRNDVCIKVLHKIVSFELCSFERNDYS